MKHLIYSGIPLLLVTILLVTSSSMTVFASQSFGAPFNLSNDSKFARFPNVASNGNNVFVAWTEGAGGVVFRSSSDGGATWNPPLTQAALRISNHGGTTMYPLISVSGSNVYVTWSQSIGTTGLQVLEATSTNNGLGFKAPVQITSGSGGSITPVIASSGSLIALGYVTGTHSFVVSSGDAGATWKKPFQLSNNHEPQVAVSGNNVYAVADKNAIAVSTDGGSSWTTHIFSPSGSEPWIAASGSNVYIAWETKGTASKVYVATSTNNGGSFTTKLLTSTLSNSWAPMIAAFNNKVYIAILQHPGVTSADIWIYTSTNNGATWSNPTSLSGTGHVVGFPVSVATSDGQNIFVMWGEQVSSNNWVARVGASGDGGTSWTQAPGINVSNNPSGNAAQGNDIATASIASSGSRGFAAWEYDTSPTNAQIYFSSS
ncbi:MAG: glycoside hydrolase [Thaumarchaeota archaeon]|nr:glycoside hydrolase [Nitrososphaerota archaeon]